MTSEITTREPMQLTAKNVDAVFKDCLTNDNGIVVKGVRIGARFNEAKVRQHEDDIFAMLMQLPEQFHRPGGGGWSFLNMCIDRNGIQWADFHQTCDALICLGLAIGAVDFLFKQRELWQCFPGGMPYIVIYDLYKNITQ